MEAFKTIIDKFGKRQASVCIETILLLLGRVSPPHSVFPCLRSFLVCFLLAVVSSLLAPNVQSVPRETSVVFLSFYYTLSIHSCLVYCYLEPKAYVTARSVIFRSQRGRSAAALAGAAERYQVSSEEHDKRGEAIFRRVYFFVPVKGFATHAL